MVPIDADVDGLGGAHPESFPEKDGQGVTLAVRLIGMATSEVPCPTCDAEAGKPCYFEPPPIRNVPPGHVHRRRLGMDLDALVARLSLDDA